MAKAKTDANWQELDVASLDDQAAANYAGYKAAYRLMKEARLAFEVGLEAQAKRESVIPTGFRMVFGYNFGKLSVAIVADDRKPEKAPKRVLTLADLGR